MDVQILVDFLFSTFTASSVKLISELRLFVSLAVSLSQERSHKDSCYVKELSNRRTCTHPSYFLAIQKVKDSPSLPGVSQSEYLKSYTWSYYAWNYEWFSWENRSSISTRLAHQLFISMKKWIHRPVLKSAVAAVTQTNLLTPIGQRVEPFKYNIYRSFRIAMLITVSYRRRQKYRVHLIK